MVTRDAQSISPGRDPQRLRAYLTAVALNSAGIVDDVTLWTVAGIAKDTARAYDTLLQDLLVIDRLPAWTSKWTSKWTRCTDLGHLELMASAGAQCSRM